MSLSCSTDELNAILDVYYIDTIKYEGTLNSSKLMLYCLLHSYENFYNDIRLLVVHSCTSICSIKITDHVMM